MRLSKIITAMAELFFSSHVRHNVPGPYFLCHWP
jgi:hypothetical protein